MVDFYSIHVGSWFYNIHVGKYTMTMDPLGRELDFVENVGSLNEPVRPMEPFSISIGGILSKSFLWKKKSDQWPIQKKCVYDSI